MRLRDRFRVFLGAPSPEELRALEILRGFKRAHARTRDAVDAFASRLVYASSLRATRRAPGDPVVLTIDVREAWVLELLNAVYGEEHPITTTFRQRIAIAVSALES